MYRLATPGATFGAQGFMVVPEEYLGNLVERLAENFIKARRATNVEVRPTTKEELVSELTRLHQTYPLLVASGDPKSKEDGRSRAFAFVVRNVGVRVWSSDEDIPLGDFGVIGPFHAPEPFSPLVYPRTLDYASEGFFHPHVNSGSGGCPCLGDTAKVLASLGYRSPTAVADCMASFLFSFNGDSPYYSPARFSKGYRCPDCRKTLLAGRGNRRACAACQKIICEKCGLALLGGCPICGEALLAEELVVVLCGGCRSANKSFRQVLKAIRPTSLGEFGIPGSGCVACSAEFTGYTELTKQLRIAPGRDWLPCRDCIASWAGYLGAWIRGQEPRFTEAATRDLARGLLIAPDKSGNQGSCRCGACMPEIFLANTPPVLTEVRRTDNAPNPLFGKRLLKLAKDWLENGSRATIHQAWAAKAARQGTPQ